MSTPGGSVPRSRDADLGSLRIDRGAAPRRRRRGGVWIVVALVVLVTGALVLRGRAGLLPGSAPKVETTVAMRPAAGSPAARTLLTANGYVEARRTAAVSAEVTGRLLRLLVHENSRVERGQLLAELANDDLRAQVARAAADVAVRRAAVQEARAESTAAENELARQRELLSRQLSTQATLDAALSRRDVVVARISSAREQLTSTQAQLQLSRAELAKTRIHAPFSGTVLRKNAEVGEMVAPVSLGGSGSRGAIVTLADLDSLDVAVDVNEAYIGRLRLGQPAQVSVDAYPDTTFAARVRQIVPTSDRQKATVLVKAELLHRNTQLLPDMSAKVTFLSMADSSATSAPGLSHASVPEAAVQRDGAQTFVWMLRADNTVERREVRLGSTSGGQVEVLSGLAGGETLVLRPSRPLRDGARVRPS